nr:MAG TPA: hypothetical protein [Caudoviricetes sp.]
MNKIYQICYNESTIQNYVKKVKIKICKNLY